MTEKSSLIFRKSVIAILYLGLVIEIIRDIFVDGDFKGYIIAGELVLENENIYSHFLNTWPPFFSLFCVPLTWLDNLSSIGLRFVWLAGSLFSFCVIMNLTAQLFLKKKIQFNVFASTHEHKIPLTDTIILIPFLILFRFILENLSNIQINTYLLLLCMLSIYFFTKGKNMLSGIFLAFAISLKVYPIFLLLYFIFKREFKIAGFTLLFIIVFNSITLLVWGSEQTIQYYTEWYYRFVVPFADANHKNQSVFALFRRLFTDADTHFPMLINLVNFEIYQLKMLSYTVIVFAALFPAWYFRNKISETANITTLLQFSFVLTAIPLLSPLAWKAYFIFLWLGYFSSYYLLFYYKLVLNSSLELFLKTSFFISVGLNVFSTELFVGGYFSDVLEVFSCIALGTIVLLIVQLVLYTQLDKTKT